MRHLVREGLWVIVGQALAILGALVGVRLMTEFLTPDAYGELTLGLTAATLVNQSVLGPLSNGVTRFYAPAMERGDIGGYLDGVRRLVVAATGMLAIAIMLTAACLLFIDQTKWIQLAVVAIIFAIFSGYNAILGGIQNAARQRTIVALHQGMDSWVRWLFAVGLMVALGASGAVALAGYAVGAVVVLGSQYMFFRKYIAVTHSAESVCGYWREEILRYSLPFASWGIFTWLRLVSDRWAIGVYDTTHDVGLYAVLYQIGYYPTTMATGLAIQFLSPILFRRAGDATDARRIAGVDRLSWQLTWVVLGLTCFIVALGFGLHRQIFHLLVAKQYWSMSYLLPWMLLAGGVFATVQPLGLNIQSRMRPNVMAVAMIVSSVFGVVLNFVGAYMYGVSGVVFASIGFSVLYAVWMAMLSMRVAAVTSS